MYEEMSDHELSELLLDLDNELSEFAKRHSKCEESAIAVATMCLKTALSIYKTNMTDDETTATVRYALAELSNVVPLVTGNITKH